MLIAGSRASPVQATQFASAQLFGEFSDQTTLITIPFVSGA